MSRCLDFIFLLQNKEFRSRNSRAERGRFSDRFLLRASAHPAERFYITGNAVFCYIKKTAARQFPLTTRQSSFCKTFWILCTLYFTGSQAGSTYVHFLRYTVYLDLYRFYVRFPHFVGSSMWMTYVVSEMSAFFTNCTLCHDCTSLTYVLKPDIVNPGSQHILF